MNKDKSFSNFERYETSNSNPLAFLTEEDNKTETAATEFNNTDSPLAFLNDYETAKDKNYKGNPLLFLEKANNLEEEILNSFKYYGLVEALRKYHKGIELEQDELKLILDFVAQFPNKKLEDLED
ncbi:hypothetical protein [Bacillus cereus]|uniref:Uncharacterized protein n=1 Tax=Bacillus cereus HuA4-10 TaxID=1053206 RepID=J8D726_BACCE|nr:hypothetical protein [Bacillus cereus]EJQ71895.1 hypothetical protein IGC_05620 [Bacillus cereus HuA4-10]